MAFLLIQEMTAYLLNTLLSIQQGFKADNAWVIASFLNAFYEYAILESFL